MARPARVERGNLRVCWCSAELTTAAQADERAGESGRSALRWPTAVKAILTNERFTTSVNRRSDPTRPWRIPRNAWPEVNQCPGEPLVGAGFADVSEASTHVDGRPVSHVHDRWPVRPRRILRSSRCVSPSRSDVVRNTMMKSLTFGTAFIMTFIIVDAVARDDYRPSAAPSWRHGDDVVGKWEEGHDKHSQPRVCLNEPAPTARDFQ
jgi:hypothetical protein